MKEKEDKTILLYNPISQTGHLDSWLLMFITILVKKGFKIICITPDPDSLLQNLNLKSHLFNEGVVILPYALEKYKHESKKPKIIYKKKGGYEVTYLPIRNLFENLDKNRWKKNGKQLLVILFENFRRNPLYLIYILNRVFSFFVSKIIFKPIDGYLDPIQMMIRISKSLESFHASPDLLFIMYLDLFPNNYRKWKKACKIVNFPVTGLRFVPFLPSEEDFFCRLSAVCGLCLLEDEAYISYKKRFKNKIFQLLPDITNTDLPQKDTPIVSRIRDFKKLRKMVFLGGSITQRKNLILFLKLIELADPDLWCFIIAGQIFEDTFTDETLRIYERAKKGRPENLLILNQYFPYESDLNAIIHISDIIFAVYLDFKGSSNMLSKAAFFEKPILVSNKHLMGERVSRYGIGISVIDDDPSMVMSQMEYLSINPISSKNFADYRNNFNEEKMGCALKLFFNNCMREKNIRFFLKSR